MLNESAYIPEIVRGDPELVFTAPKHERTQQFLSRIL